MSIYTHVPATWTADTPIPNANTFNVEIKEKMTDVDNANTVEAAARVAGDAAGKSTVLRQNIASNSSIANTVILTGWKFASLPNVLNYQAIGITFGITFSEIPIVTVTPISKCVGSDPTTLTQLCESSHAALETVKVGDISTTGFTGEVWSSVAYSAGDRVGFMWTAIGQLN